METSPSLNFSEPSDAVILLKFSPTPFVEVIVAVAVRIEDSVVTVLAAQAAVLLLLASAIEGSKEKQFLITDETKDDEEKSGEEKDLIIAVADGVAAREPELTDEGSGGTYFVSSSDGERVAVFKPSDEEPGAQNNPREGITKSSLRKGFVPGEGYLREVLAYHLDKEHLAGVPTTAIVEVERESLWPGISKKRGSAQKFVRSSGCACDFGPARFDRERCHEIALLDLRLCNTDRHGGNLLVDEDDESKLVPIDHGYCLPAYPDLGELWFDWVTWPQSKLQMTQQCRERAMSIDADEDAAAARRAGIREECVKTLLIGDTLVRVGAEQGLTVAEMGHIACRMDGLDKPSELERMCQAAEEQCEAKKSANGEKAPPVSIRDEFFTKLSAIMSDRMKALVNERK